MWRGGSTEARLVEVKGIPESLQSLARYWGELWGVPGRRGPVTVEYSARFRTSLGLCGPAQGRIRLAASVVNGDGPREGGTDLLEGVLCHELAHAAVHRLYRRQAKPHGPEWRRLVREAGFEPRLSIMTDEALGGPRRDGLGNKPRRPRWEHRCPVCHTRRMAGRPVPEWRCAECLEAGLSGGMVITNVAPPKEGTHR